MTNVLILHSDCPQQAAVQPQFPGFTPQALRILSYFTAAAGTQRSEDCLTLNIWSKETARSVQADKPVFVLFHGGRQSQDSVSVVSWFTEARQDSLVAIPILHLPMVSISPMPRTLL